MVAVRINGIAPISKIGPNRVRQEFILTNGGPARQTTRMPMMCSQDLLQKDDIGVRGTYGVTQLMQDEAAVEKGEPLMGVHRQDTQSVGGPFGMHCGSLKP